MVLARFERLSRRSSHWLGNAEAEAGNTEADRLAVVTK
jgi:hypothetical protein